MKHFTVPSFWESYARLSPGVKETADKSFELLKKDASYPSLHLKKVDRFWSVRVGMKHRALAVEIGEGLLWFWIGHHTEYDRILRSKV